MYAQLTGWEARAIARGRSDAVSASITSNENSGIDAWPQRTKIAAPAVNSAPKKAAQASAHTAPLRACVANVTQANDPNPMASTAL